MDAEQSADLKLYFHNDTSTSFTFIDQPVFVNDQFNPAAVVATVHKYIKAYNIKQTEIDKKISYKAGFFATHAGAVTIYVTSALIILIVIGILSGLGHKKPVINVLAGLWSGFYYFTAFWAYRKKYKQLFLKMTE